MDVGGGAGGAHQQLIQDGDGAGGSGLQLGFVAGVILR